MRTVALVTRSAASFPKVYRVLDDRHVRGSLW